MDPQPFIVKLDEDLSPRVAAPLAGLGFDVRTVFGQGWSGLSDQELFPRVAQEQAFFITGDKGFGDLRVFTPGTHPGILLLRPANDSIPELQTVLKLALQACDLRQLAGCVAVASNSGLRIRRPQAQ